MLACRARLGLQLLGQGCAGLLAPSPVPTAPGSLCCSIPDSPGLSCQLRLQPLQILTAQGFPVLAFHQCLPVWNCVYSHPELHVCCLSVSSAGCPAVLLLAWLPRCLMPVEEPKGKFWGWVLKRGLSNMENTIGSWLKAGIAACEPPTVDRMDVECLQAVQELAELSPGVLTPRDHWSTEQCPSLCYHICLCIDDASSFSFCFLHKPLPFSLQQQPLGSVPISTVGVMACHCVALGSWLAAPCACRACPLPLRAGLALTWLNSCKET